MMFMAATLQKHGYPHALALLLPRRCGILAVALPLLVRAWWRARAIRYRSCRAAASRRSAGWPQGPPALRTSPPPIARFPRAIALAVPAAPGAVGASRLGSSLLFLPAVAFRADFLAAPSLLPPCGGGRFRLEVVGDQITAPAGHYKNTFLYYILPRKL